MKIQKQLPPTMGLEQLQTYSAQVPRRCSRPILTQGRAITEPTKSMKANLISEVADFVAECQYEDDYDPAHYVDRQTGQIIAPTFTLPCLHNMAGREDVVLLALAMGAAHGLTPQQTLELWARANWLQDAVVVQQGVAEAQNALRDAYRQVYVYSAYCGEPTPEIVAANERYVAATENLAAVAERSGATPETVAWIRESPHMAARGHEVPLS